MAFKSNNFNPVKGPLPGLRPGHGSDLRFTNAAGAELPFEIESWDAVGRNAAAWVKTDVKGNDKSQYIVMHWGNPAATAASDGKKLFTKGGNANAWQGTDVKNGEWFHLVLVLDKPKVIYYVNGIHEGSTFASARILLP